MAVNLKLLVPFLLFEGPLLPLCEHKPKAFVQFIYLTVCRAYQLNFAL